MTLIEINYICIYQHFLKVRLNVLHHDENVAHLINHFWSDYVKYFSCEYIVPHHCQLN